MAAKSQKLLAAEAELEKLRRERDILVAYAHDVANNVPPTACERVHMSEFAKDGNEWLEYRLYRPLGGPGGYVVCLSEIPGQKVNVDVALLDDLIAWKNEHAAHTPGRLAAYTLIEKLSTARQRVYEHERKVTA